MSTETNDGIPLYVREESEPAGLPAGRIRITELADSDPVSILQEWGVDGSELPTIGQAKLFGQFFYEPGVAGRGFGFEVVIAPPSDES